VVKLLDFRHRQLMQRDAEAGLTSSHASGHVVHHGPEQIRGDGVDPRTDIYALGVVLYHLVTGQYPFRRRDHDDIERQHLESPRRGQPGGARAGRAGPVVLRAMDKNIDGVSQRQSVRAGLEEAVADRERRRDGAPPPPSTSRSA